MLHSIAYQSYTVTNLNSMCNYYFCRIYDDQSYELLAKEIKVRGWSDKQ